MKLPKLSSIRLIFFASNQIHRSLDTPVCMDDSDHFLSDEISFISAYMDLIVKLVIANSLSQDT